MQPNPYGGPGYGHPNMMGGPQMHGSGYGNSGGSHRKHSFISVQTHAMQLTTFLGSGVPFRAGDWRCGREGCMYHNFAKNVSDSVHPFLRLSPEANMLRRRACAAVRRVVRLRSLPKAEAWCPTTRALRMHQHQACLWLLWTIAATAGCRRRTTPTATLLWVLLQVDSEANLSALHPRMLFRQASERQAHTWVVGIRRCRPTAQLKVPVASTAALSKLSTRVIHLLQAERLLAIPTVATIVGVVYTVVRMSLWHFLARE